MAFEWRRQDAPRKWWSGLPPYRFNGSFQPIIASELIVDSPATYRRDATRSSTAPFKRLTRRARSICVNALLDGASLFRRIKARIVREERHASGRRPRILVVDEMLPDPRFGAGYPRAAAIIYALVASGWDVTMYPMGASPADYTMVRERFAARSVRFITSRGPRGLRRLIRENLRSFDVTLISRPENMRIFSNISADTGYRTHCVYDAEAVFVAREQRRLALFQNPMTEGEYERALDSEVAVVAGADALITVTETEANLFRSRSPVPVHVVKHCIAVRDDVPGFDERVDLLFVGRCAGAREQLPNVDSLYWFVQEVMPLIDSKMNADYRLIVVGLADDAIVSALGSERVTFRGVVDDLDAIYDQCRVFVAPTRFAAGVPLKVVEAAAAGIPCVVTELLAEQWRFNMTSNYWQRQTRFNLPIVASSSTSLRIYGIASGTMREPGSRKSTTVRRSVSQFGERLRIEDAPVMACQSERPLNVSTHRSNPTPVHSI